MVPKRGLEPPVAEHCLEFMVPKKGLEPPVAEHCLEFMVPKRGLEPPHPCEYMDLNHARLPIPPFRLTLQARLAILQRANCVKFKCSRVGGWCQSPAREIVRLALVGSNVDL